MQNINEYKNMEISELKIQLEELTIIEIAKIAGEFGYKGNLKKLAKSSKEIVIYVACQSSPMNKTEDTKPASSSSPRNKIWGNKIVNLSKFLKDFNDKFDEEKEIVSSSIDKIDYCFHVQKCSELPMPRGILIDAKTFMSICTNYDVEDNSNILYYKGNHYKFVDDKKAIENSQTGDCSSISNSSTGFKHKSDFNPKQQWGKLFAPIGIFCKAYVIESDKELSDNTTLYEKDPKTCADHGYDVVIGLYPLASELSPKIGRSKKSQQIPIDNFLSEFSHNRNDLIEKSDLFQSSIIQSFAIKEMQKQK